MPAPNLTIRLEPVEAGAMVYGSLAAQSTSDSPTGELLVVAIMTNHEPAALVVTQATVSFVGSLAVGASTFVPGTVGTVPPATTNVWFMGSVILPASAPAAVTVTLSFVGFDSISVDMPLAQYASPAAGGGYAFPAQSSDLLYGEFWSGTSGIHGLAYDLYVQVFSAATGRWETLPPGADNSQNSNYYLWGKPIYAMADGAVVEFKDGIPANTPPNFPVTPPLGIYEGNHFYIQHGTDLALYAHFQAGTLNPALMVVGAAVTQGQLLGLAGNSGNSSMPHLHVHVLRATVPWGGPPRPLPFSGIHVLDLAVAYSSTWPPTSALPWNTVTAQGLPSVSSAIWPGPMLVGRKSLWPIVQNLAWIWMVVIGGLMLTPGGIDCIVCGPPLTVALGIVSVVLGAIGIVAQLVAIGAAATQRASIRKATLPAADGLHDRLPRIDT